MNRSFNAIAHLISIEQERWFLWWPVLFGLGIAGYFALLTEPAIGPLCAIAALALMAHRVARSRGLWILPAAIISAIALGGLAAKLRTEAIRAPVLASGPVNVTVRGWLELVEPRPVKGQRLTMRIAEVDRLPRTQWPFRVRVTTRFADETLRPGDAVTLRATLNPPAGPVLPGAYDFGRAAWYMRLGAVGYSSGRTKPWQTNPEKPVDLKIITAIEGFRLSITHRIRRALPGETGAIAAALITGERGGISDATNNAYRASGLFHVLSISGLHMVIMAGALFWLVRLLLAAIPAIAIRYPVKKLAAAIALAGALGYLLISGIAVATVRSYVMISIMFIAILLDRPAVALRNVALAAAAILIVTPESVLDAGFQMSFAAVTGLVSVFEGLRLRREALNHEGRGDTALASPLRHFSEIVGSTLIASIVVAPFGIYHFHNTQTLALIANVLAIPVCNILVMPAALVAFLAMPLGLEWYPLQAMGFGIELMGRVANWVASLPGAIVRVPDIPTLSFALMVAGGLWLLLWTRKWRFAGLIPILAGLFVAPTAQRPDVIIGRDGSSVAFRTDEGALGLIAPRGSAFEAGRWLEHDGDKRSWQDAVTATPVACDGAACAARVAGRTLAILTHPASLAEDCSTADIIVAAFPVPARCGGPDDPPSINAPRKGATHKPKPSDIRPLVIDATAVARDGVHVVTFPRQHRSQHNSKTANSSAAVATPIVSTVEDLRGHRPWGQYTTSAAAEDQQTSTRTDTSRQAAQTQTQQQRQQSSRTAPKATDSTKPTAKH